MMKIINKFDSPWMVAGVLLFFVTLFWLSLPESVGAKNPIIPLWGSDVARTCTWHSDTNASGDEIVYANEYHWDTISMRGFNRSDGEATYGLGINPWSWDGCKLYLKIGATSPGCSIRVHFNIGTEDTMHSTKHDSIEGADLEKIYSFFDWYDSDTLSLLDRLDIDIIYGDTITNDTQEFDRTFEVRGIWGCKDD